MWATCVKQMAAPPMSQGVVCSLKENFGFIERADLVKEIFFHYSEYSDNIAELVLGDDVEFSIQTRNVRTGYYLLTLNVQLSPVNCNSCINRTLGHAYYISQFCTFLF